MILDKLSNINLYENINNNLKKAINFLKSSDLESLSDGRYEIDSDNVYAFVQSYETKSAEDNKWESHEKYIDIQYIFHGKETILWSPIDQLSITEKYSNEKDVTFYKSNSYSTKLNLNENYFCMLFPKDGHKPGCILDAPSQVKKIVLKIKL